MRFAKWSILLVVCIGIILISMPIVSAKIINLDTMPPVTKVKVTGTMGDNGWYTSIPTITFSAKDLKGSGVDYIEYCLDYGQAVLTWSRYNGPFTLVDTEWGIEYRSVDKAGNVENSKYTTVKVDTTAPVIDITTPSEGAVYTQGSTVLADFTAKEFPESEIEFQCSEVATVTSTVPNGQGIDTSTTGAKTFTVTVTDNAGNTNTKTVHYTVTTPDLIEPVTTASLSGTMGNNGWYKSPVTVTLTAADSGGSGIKYTEFWYEDPSWSDLGWEWRVYDGPFTYLGDGGWGIHYRSMDQAGNLEEEKYIGYNVDTTPPDIDIITPADGATYTWSPLLRLRADWVASDIPAGDYIVSGLESATGTVPSGQLFSPSLGSRSFTVTATDKAGNTNTKTIHYTVRSPVLPPL